MTMSQIWLAGEGLTHSTCAVDFPRPDRLVKGNPERHTYSAYAHPNMDCGIWQCEVGAWNIVFAPDKQEFFTVIEGRVRLHHKHSDVVIEVGAGEAGIIPPAFEGTFEVVEKVKKYYVVVEA
jgi:uncharacterized cupin superfamily protein